MNTVKKGDLFEDKCYEIINSALINGELGIIPSFSKIYQKKKYYSIKRKADIIFDISIEVTPLNAKKPTLIYIIECKDLNKKVPVDDVEEFESKIGGLQGFQVKGIFISNTSFQKSSYNLADNSGFMLIEVNQSGYNIVLHKSKITEVVIDPVISSIQIKLYDYFLIKKITGLKKLSKKQINIISLEIISNFFRNTENSHYNVSNLKEYLIVNHNLKFDLIPMQSNQLGQYIPSEEKILINESLLKTNKYNFVFFHEVSHYFLHKDILVNKNIYDLFSDAEFDFIENKYILDNPKNWIEWQANYLASCLALPEDDLIYQIVRWQTINNIRNRGTIYLDKQKVNRDDFKAISEYLSNYFDISKTVIKYRLLDLKILKIDSSFKQNFIDGYKDAVVDDIEEIRRKSIERARERYDF